MTTDHASKIIGFGGTQTLAGMQRAASIKRLGPLVHDGMSGTSIRHYVAGPWPLASDAFGVAYPAGLLLVAGDVGLFGSGTIDQQCENFWQNAVTAGGTANVFAVPQVLPGSYTPSGQSGYFGFTSQVFPGPPWFRFTQSGIATNTGWTPRIASNGDTFTTGLFRCNPATGSNDTFRLSSLFVPITADVGYRKCQLSFVVSYTSGASLVAMDAGGALNFTISHNADGSVGSGTGDLDTIDYTGSVTAAQLNTGLSHVGSTTIGQYGPSDIGALSAPLGKPCRFAIRVTSNTLTYTLPVIGAQSVVNWGATCQASLRCDIPFQCDLVGAGDLVAPGGYVP